MGIEYLKKIKKERNIKTEELSEKSGVPIGTLNKIFAGQTIDPKFETVKAICKALDISLAELDNYENNTPIDYSYYYDHGTLELAQELRDDKALRMLMYASRGAKAEDLQLAADMIKRLKGEE